MDTSNWYSGRLNQYVDLSRFSTEQLIAEIIYEHQYFSDFYKDLLASGWASDESLAREKAEDKRKKELREQIEAED